MLTKNYFKITLQNVVLECPYIFEVVVVMLCRSKTTLIRDTVMRQDTRKTIVYTMSLSDNILFHTIHTCWCQFNLFTLPEIIKQ